MTVEVFNQKNKAVGKVDLSETVFNAKWRPALVKQVVTAQIANRREPLAHTKTRGEVRGGGKKPWAQKHTGRARAGSSRSPLWTGGGVTFGPRNERIFRKKVNKKMKRLALYSTLSKKLDDKELFVVDNFKLEKPKTQIAAKILETFFKKAASTLLIVDRGNRNIFLGARNIPKTKIVSLDSLNVYDCLASKYILIEQGVAESMTK